MGRSLPWLKNKTTTPTCTSSSALAKTALPSSPESPPASPKNGVLSRLGKHSSASHAAALLPPTDPRPLKPLPEHFMIPGFQHDDRWRMVEDEFVAVAHKFTAHIHASEYQRLKKLAHEQKTEAAALSISRPVTGPMTDAVRRRQAAQTLEVTQKRGIKRALSRTTTAAANDDQGEATNLHTLLETPRKKPVSLSKLLPALPSNTRAAALISRQNAASTSHAPATVARRGPKPVARQPSPIAIREASSATQDSKNTQDDNESDSDDWFTKRRRLKATKARARRRPSPDGGNDVVSAKEQGRSTDSSQNSQGHNAAMSIPSI